MGQESQYDPDFRVEDITTENEKAIRVIRECLDKLESQVLLRALEHSPCRAEVPQTEPTKARPRKRKDRS